MVIRRLNTSEEAFTLANDHHPLVVVVVLHLGKSISEESMTSALKALQSRHQLLNAGISGLPGKRYFRALESTRPIPLAYTERTSESDWKRLAGDLINTKYDISGPLLKVSCLASGKPESRMEIILTLHHAIADGAGLQLILGELLSLVGGLELPPMPQKTNFSSLPELPVEYRGVRLFRHVLPFMLREIKDEIGFKKGGFIGPIPKKAHNSLINLSLSLDLSRKLIIKAASQGISINSLIMAAMLLATKKELHSGKGSKIFRAITFADLRPYLNGDAPPSYLGCHAAMMRFSIDAGPEESLTNLARKLWKAIREGGKRGDMFLQARLSFRLIKTALAIKKFRLGNAALSYWGKLELAPQYGRINLLDVKAFITNNQYGPEFSGFAKVLFGRISMDFTYLTAETSEEQAEKIVGAIRSSLEEFALT